MKLNKPDFCIIKYWSFSVLKISKIIIVDNINNADYITNNFTDWRGEIKPTNFIKPENFNIIHEIKVDDITINTIYKKKQYKPKIEKLYFFGFARFSKFLWENPISI